MKNFFKFIFSTPSRDNEVTQPAIDLSVNLNAAVKDKDAKALLTSYNTENNELKSTLETIISDESHPLKAEAQQLQSVLDNVQKLAGNTSNELSPSYLSKVCLDEFKRTDPVSIVGPEVMTSLRTQVINGAKKDYKKALSLMSDEELKAEVTRREENKGNILEASTEVEFQAVMEFHKVEQAILEFKKVEQAIGEKTKLQPEQKAKLRMDAMVTERSIAELSRDMDNKDLNDLRRTDSRSTDSRVKDNKQDTLKAHIKSKDQLYSAMQEHGISFDKAGNPEYNELAEKGLTASERRDLRTIAAERTLARTQDSKPESALDSDVPDKNLAALERKIAMTNAALKEFTFGNEQENKEVLDTFIEKEDVKQDEITTLQASQEYMQLELSYLKSLKGNKTSPSAEDIEKGREAFFKTKGADLTSLRKNAKLGMRGFSKGDDLVKMAFKCKGIIEKVKSSEGYEKKFGNVTSQLENFANNYLTMQTANIAGIGATRDYFNKNLFGSSLDIVYSSDVKGTKSLSDRNFDKQQFKEWQKLSGNENFNEKDFKLVKEFNAQKDFNDFDEFLKNKNTEFQKQLIAACIRTDDQKIYDNLEREFALKKKGGDVSQMPESLQKDSATLKKTLEAQYKATKLKLEKNPEFTKKDIAQQNRDIKAAIKADQKDKGVAEMLTGGQIDAYFAVKTQEPQYTEGLSDAVSDAERTIPSNVEGYIFPSENDKGLQKRSGAKATGFMGKANAAFKVANKLVTGDKKTAENAVTDGSYENYRQFKEPLRNLRLAMVQQIPKEKSLAEYANELQNNEDTRNNLGEAAHLSGDLLDAVIMGESKKLTDAQTLDDQYNEYLNENPDEQKDLEGFKRFLNTSDSKAGKAASVLLAKYPNLEEIMENAKMRKNEPFMHAVVSSWAADVGRGEAFESKAQLQAKVSEHRQSIGETQYIKGCEESVEKLRDQPPGTRVRFSRDIMVDFEVSSELLGEATVVGVAASVEVGGAFGLSDALEARVKDDGKYELQFDTSKSAGASLGLTFLEAFKVGTSGKRQNTDIIAFEFDSINEMKDAVGGMLSNPETIGDLIENGNFSIIEGKAKSTELGASAKVVFFEGVVEGTGIFDEIETESKEKAEAMTRMILGQEVSESSGFSHKEIANKLTKSAETKVAKATDYLSPEAGATVEYVKKHMVSPNSTEPPPTTEFFSNSKIFAKSTKIRGKETSLQKVHTDEVMMESGYLTSYMVKETYSVPDGELKDVLNNVSNKQDRAKLEQQFEEAQKKDSTKALRGEFTYEKRLTEEAVKTLNQKLRDEYANKLNPEEDQAAYKKAKQTLFQKALKEVAKKPENYEISRLANRTTESVLLDEVKAGYEVRMVASVNAVKSQTRGEENIRELFNIDEERNAGLKNRTTDLANAIAGEDAHKLEANQNQEQEKGQEQENPKKRTFFQRIYDTAVKVLKTVQDRVFGSDEKNAEGQDIPVEAEEVEAVEAEEVEAVEAVVAVEASNEQAKGNEQEAKVMNTEMKSTENNTEQQKLADFMAEKRANAQAEAEQAANGLDENRTDKPEQAANDGLDELLNTDILQEDPKSKTLTKEASKILKDLVTNIDPQTLEDLTSIDAESKDPKPAPVQGIDSLSGNNEKSR